MHVGPPIRAMFDEHSDFEFVRRVEYVKKNVAEREREKCYPHQARKAYLGSAMRDR